MFFLQATLSTTLNLHLKFGAILSNLQRYDTISAHVPKRVLQFASENFSKQEWPLYKRL